MCYKYLCFYLKLKLEFEKVKCLQKKNYFQCMNLALACLKYIMTDREKQINFTDINF